MRQHLSRFTARREFLKFLAASPYVAALGGVTTFLEQSGLAENAQEAAANKRTFADVLATLEQESPEIQVLQARANLAASDAKLSTIQAGAKPDDVAAADEALSQQQAKLAAMLAQGRTEDVAAAQAGLAAVHLAGLADCSRRAYRSSTWLAFSRASSTAWGRS